MMVHTLKLEGGPADGQTVIVDDDIIRCGTYYVIERPTLYEIVSTYRYKRKADKTYAYNIREMVNGGYVGIFR